MARLSVGGATGGTFDVSCFNRTSGRLAWSMTVEAPSPAHAIARACLPRAGWAGFLAGLDDSATGELMTPHPAPGMAACFDVAAEVIP